MLKTNSRRHSEIMEGAREVFLSQGFDAASMGEIACEAQVSKGTLYVYFDSKERLFEAMALAHYRKLDAAMPSFFEMLGENATCYLQNITTYAQACLLFIDAGDPESFADARRSLIFQACTFADISRPIGERHTLDLERADRLNAEAARHER